MGGSVLPVLRPPAVAVQQLHPAHVPRTVCRCFWWQAMEALSFTRAVLDGLFLTISGHSLPELVTISDPLVSISVH